MCTGVPSFPPPLLSFPSSSEHSTLAQIYWKLKKRKDDEFGDVPTAEEIVKQMEDGVYTTADLCQPWIVPYR